MDGFVKFIFKLIKSISVHPNIKFLEKHFSLHSTNPLLKDYLLSNLPCHPIL